MPSVEEMNTEIPDKNTRGFLNLSSQEFKLAFLPPCGTLGALWGPTDLNQS